VQERRKAAEARRDVAVQLGGDRVDQLRRRSRDAVEGPSIALFPDKPGGGEHERVECAMTVSRHSAMRQEPPVW
jgi:hypothetical protein